jgi:leucyl aminopeptidase (aminopeptidase T)
MVEIPNFLKKLTEAWENILNHCIRVRKKDKILFVFDASVKNIAEAFFYATQGLSNPITPIYYPYLLQKSTPKIKKSMPIHQIVESSDVLITALTDAVKCTAFRGSLISLASAFNSRVLHMPGARSEFLTKSALNIDFNKINKEANKFSNLLTKSKYALIVTHSKFNKEEHKLLLKMTGRVGHSDGGLLRPGKIINIPTGEAYIAPLENSAKGSVVISGSFPKCKLGDEDEIILYFENGFLNLNKSVFTVSSNVKDCKTLLKEAKKIG